ncbi:hypothetical protein C7382_10436 [Porphyromonas loveana]|uniref:Uncharacterized protein n=1 Tax=Porphyromonas loveana TaxID=1884669 RepID=A0A2U1FKN7_9PORP|nr:hypothetical protein C7382_10436 [Porphyromonas loveana]
MHTPIGQDNLLTHISDRIRKCGDSQVHTPIGQDSLLTHDYYDDSDCRETSAFALFSKLLR